MAINKNLDARNYKVAATLIKVHFPCNKLSNLSFRVFCPRLWWKQSQWKRNINCVKKTGFKIPLLGHSCVHHAQVWLTVEISAALCATPQFCSVQRFDI